MFRHSLVVLLVLWASCSVVQSFPANAESQDELETDSFMDGNQTTHDEMFNQFPIVLEDDTLLEEELTIPEEVDSKPLENENLFEGDLAIPEDLIEEFYSNDSSRKRAAIERSSRLWPSERVYYRYASDVSSYAQNAIRSAMDYYETHTRLRFYYRTYGNYIEFTTDADQCSSDWIGCKGGRQVIKLGPGCVTKGIILHEIGHAIGFWHEQSRPDRNYYVTILTGNIENGKHHNFDKRTHSEVDSLGYPYDYSSIMHYSKTAFSRNGYPTILVHSSTGYSYWGSPSQVGQRSYLSSGDRAQINRLYENCPRQLRIYARYGRNLPDRDGWGAGDSDPYMEFVAYDLYGGSLRRTTSTDQGDESPEWYEWLDFGTRVWTKFTAKVWDNDLFSDDALSNTHTWTIYQGSHQNQWIHWSSINGWVYFDYYYE